MSDKSGESAVHDQAAPAQRKTTDQRLFQIAETLGLDVAFFSLTEDQRWQSAPGLSRTLAFVASAEGQKLVAFLMRIKDAELRQRSVELILNVSSSCDLFPNEGGSGVNRKTVSGKTSATLLRSGLLRVGRAK